MERATADKGGSSTSCNSGEGPSSSRARTLLAIKLIVFVDFLGVAVVVPLLSSYFRDLNITTELYGLVTSFYSASQIIGGLVLGSLSDGFLSRRQTLLISFVGSAISYGLVGVSNSLWMLLMGRVLVGLVKQTMTVSTALIAEHSAGGPEGGRAKELSHLTAAATISFILGPAMGSYLYTYSKMLPPLVSCGMFALNSFLVILLLPSERGAAATGGGGQGGGEEADKEHKNRSSSTEATAGMMGEVGGGEEEDRQPLLSSECCFEGERGEEASLMVRMRRQSSSGTNVSPTADATAASATRRGGGCDAAAKGKKGATNRFVENLKFTCTRGPCIRIVLAKLFSGLMFRALSPASFVGYFEERFNVESHILGYISSYRATLSLLVQIYVVGRLAGKVKESTLVAWALAGLVVSNMVEATQITLWGFLVLVVPVSVLGGALLMTCLSSLFTQRIRQEDMGAALGTLNVLQSGVGVVAPIYGGLLFQHMGVAMRPAVAGLHYLVFFAAWMVWEVGPSEPKAKQEGSGGEGTDPAARKDGVKEE